ncbi:hypothetical protein BAY61_18155 [Prauserella marina]|uniref:Uncharacterized protein n=1 Tax=Prauserella marina TaxID=530584 RepID=A0A222VRN3_9PSEU|nr:hypothetical protein BAY61_18155 [Prauserella marina]PWV74016.1 hypothetical protein DES30_108190 [Prauserella marina]SDD60970.1 hypothetical protein SAMN05421630_110191 [Prauserella marina]
MATTEEIERRIEEADAARSAKRAAVATRVGELAQRRDAVAVQLAEIERELGEALAEAGSIIGVEELAQFTDVPAADLTRWLTNHQAPRPKRQKRPSRTASRKPSTRDKPAVPPTNARRVPDPAANGATTMGSEPVPAEAR